MDDAGLLAELQAEHDELRRQFLGGELNSAELAALCVLLRAHAAELTDPDRNRFAAKLDALERLAGYESGAGPQPEPATGSAEPATSPAEPATNSADAAASSADALTPVQRAARALGTARRADGTVAERIARAEDGITEIRRIAAEAATARERRAILRSTDLLSRLAASLRDSTSAAEPGGAPDDTGEPPR